MPKEKTYPPLSEAYRQAWQSCTALWPIFILRLVFVVLNIGAFIFCLFLVCWPLVMALWKAFQESEGQNMIRYFQSMDWSGYFPDPHLILMAFGLGLLYITWWSLLAALFDGAVYSRFREYEKNGSFFSLTEFFKDGVRYMLPMLGLQICWFLIFTGVTLGGTILVLLLILIGHALSIPWWVGLLLTIPGIFIALGVLWALVAYAVMGGAYLMEGKGVFHALKQAFHKCAENYGRVIWAILLLWVIYLVFSVAFQSVMNIFGSLRWVGFIFLSAEFFVNLFLSIAIWVYMPALAVSFSLEKKA